MKNIIIKLEQTIEQVFASTEIQAYVFPKSDFKTKDDVKKWIKDNNVTPLKDSIDETGDSFRVRIKDPNDFKDNSFRTIDIGTHGVKGVIGKLK